jgi:DNA-binding GntR family transcriptional regulator
VDLAMVSNRDTASRDMGSRDAANKDLPARGSSRVVHREHWELICEDLKDRIIEGELAPGTRLTEMALAEEYGVSTGPVRTALMSLVQQGIATSTSRRRTEVVTFDRQDIDELYDVLEALERMAVREVAIKMDAPTYEALLERLNVLEEAQDSGDALAGVHADLDFHRTICQVSGNTRLLGLWEQLAEQARLIIATTIRFKPTTAAANAAHMPILRALKTGDPDKAEATITRHFKEAHAALSELSDDEFAEALGGARSKQALET